MFSRAWKTLEELSLMDSMAMSALDSVSEGIWMAGR